jgi:flagellar L-ring protein precursor FlgH
MTRPEVSNKKPEVRGQIKEPTNTVVLLFCSAVCLLTLSCASTPKLPPPPPRYVYEHNNQTVESSTPLPGTNSLWRDTASLVEDVKARRLNDLLTINVVENISGSGTANTATDKTSSTDGAVNNIFGIPTNLGFANMFGKGFTFAPTVNGSMTDSFKGDGATTRAGSLLGTITAKVVEVMPNGNLAIESRKDITINNEKQTLILRGMVRPDDVATDNTVLSSRVADAEVYFVGDGVVQSKQDTGWFDKILDKIWPF